MPRPLQEYNRKRDFNATPEPSGRTRSRRADAGGALQFVIQKHDASHLHYDFRLELDGTLKSWAVPKGPSLDPKQRRLAVHVEDHPLDYAGFEGHIPEGHYGAGDVIVWDRGVWIPQGDPAEAYQKGKLKFELQGEKLSGVWNLVRTRMVGKKEQWFLIKSNDDQARPESDYSIVEAEPDSVLSDRSLVPRQRGAKAETQPKPPEPAAPRRKRAVRSDSLDGAQAAQLPASLKPQLATLVESAPQGDWRYEIKFDGYRILARIEAGRARLITRNGHDWTERMPEQAKALEALGLESAWLDGEVVVLDEKGLPSFQLLQNAFEVGGRDRIIYYLFDAPYLNGMDLREVALEQRRAALAGAMKGNASDLLRFSEDFSEDAESVLASACQMQLEGLIGKRAGSTYQSRRSSSWIKIKCQNRQEFVIVGYSEPKGSRSAFGALLLGLHDESSGELRYAGRVGTGFNEATLRSLHARLRPLEIAKPALPKPPTGADARGVHWLEPTLLCEVAFAEMTREGIVRHAVFHGLRNDKPAAAITHETPKKVPAAKSGSRKKAASADSGTDAEQTRAAETASGAKKAAGAGTAGRRRSPGVEGFEQIRISNPDRIIDPSIGATKLELAQYYGGIAPWMLKDLAERPVAIVRAPEGIQGELFFQKHANKLALPHVRQLDQALDPTHAPLLVLDTPLALVSGAQMGMVEAHSWNARAPKLEKPDRFILDLDPDPALPWKRMIEATQLVLTLLDEIGLKGFLKTSGGKGLHIVVPIDRRLDWDTVKGFSQAIAQHMAKLLPTHFSAVSGPKNRVGKIFIDYLRNGRGATSVAAYSVRTREGLPVSTPIHREELADLKGANRWTIRNIFERLESLGEDPWAEMAATRQSITVAMRRQLGLE